jgi:hypothetical protein
MMTEHEVRSRVQAIRTASLSPFRKARLLLRIGRSLEAQERVLRPGIPIESDRNGYAVRQRLASRARHLREDVLDEARSLLDNKIYLS